ncbi:amt-3 [Symbiodinium sp. KB8]|nr:amt-3 [Symbiodinium sp. KB8]
MAGINADLNDEHADDATWVLTSSFCILTMQSGFGMLEMGSSSKGHEVNIVLKNIFDVVCGAMAYYMVGYGLSYGEPSNWFMGQGDFFVDANDGDHMDTGLIHSRYIFQFSFAATSTTIVSGCLAMRCRFLVYCFYSFYSVIVYAFVAHWEWAPNGWLKQLGVHDFAGSGAVSLLGAMNGLIGILWLGPRLGRFDGTRLSTDIKPSSPTTILFGLFMKCSLGLALVGVDWLQLRELVWNHKAPPLQQTKWLVATRAGVATLNATAGGGFAALFYTKAKSRGVLISPEEMPGRIANGLLGALVAITATCACVHPYEAVIVGFVGSISALACNDLFEYRLHIDDPVGAVGVHGASGIWGLIAVGLFADASLPGIEAGPLACFFVSVNPT